MAEAYRVVAVAADGHRRACNATSTNCTLSRLLCEQRYAVSVTASHENCTSRAAGNLTIATGTRPTPSHTRVHVAARDLVQLVDWFSIRTGPCQPDGLSVQYYCNNQSALLSWTRRDNAVEYYGYAQAGNGSKLLCQSTTTTCTIRGLESGSAYNFSVRASDGVCNSSLSQPVLTATGKRPFQASASPERLHHRRMNTSLPISPLSSRHCGAAAVAHAGADPGDALPVDGGRLQRRPVPAEVDGKPAGRRPGPVRPLVLLDERHLLRDPSPVRFSLHRDSGDQERRWDQRPICPPHWKHR